MVQIQRLQKVLESIKNHNVNITVIFNGLIILTIATEKFTYEMDNDFLVVGNNCSDCEFESKIPVSDIKSMDNTILEEDGIFTLCFVLQEQIVSVIIDRCTIK